MPWYADWFDTDAYEVVYRDRDTAEAERLADLIERAVRPAPGAEVLDVGTGRGRHALVLARRGLRVVGLDLAPRAVATARRRAEREGIADRARFVVGDMRALPFEDGRFDGVTNLFTSFGYFEDDADHQRAISEMARVLRPGGWLVQDFLNAPYTAAHLVPRDEREEQGVLVRQERWIEGAGTPGSSVRKRITLTPADDPKAPPHVFTERVRLLTRADLEAMYAAAGLRVVEAFGSYDGAPHGPDTPRLILHAERPPP